MHRILCLFGTRPEIIKLAPVLHALAARAGVETVQVASSQHVELLHPFARELGVRIDRDLRVMQAGQSQADVAARVLAGLDPLLAELRPDLVLVQGDTTTAMAGALAAFQRRIPVGHVEAGLRTGDVGSPFPEEMNRRLITQLASLHFAPTESNARTLRAEGVPASRIAVTGNPVVDALHEIVAKSAPSPELEASLRPLAGTRLVALTTHRRESFGALMQENLHALRRFVARHEDVSLVFPVHPNPEVRRKAEAALAGAPRTLLQGPLGYRDFLHLLASAWLIVSDSGGVQEEAPTLGKALLVLRANTERPEAVDAGVARLVGGDAQRLERELEALHADDAWVRGVSRIPNPFGQGDAGPRIADATLRFLAEGGGAHAPIAARVDVPIAARARSLADFTDEAKRVVREISPEEARRLLETEGHEGWHFVDVREPDEYAAGHVPGAKSSPRGFLEVKADLEHKKRDPWFEDRGRKLALYCGGGHRSALAAKALQEMGFRDVVSLAGGWTAWTERGYPVER
ncbi:MAG TPA: UDP-N-acetylglucosamine 2-epimerase (non-hydrolyzing) [Myxococcota bacterium]|nr:UDP-N-acetylglucosamine 2-epimerase (non-hydrolyzing) [Myxococcota bacterium]